MVLVAFEITESPLDRRDILGGAGRAFMGFVLGKAFEITESPLDRCDILGGAGRAFMDFVLGKAFGGPFFSGAFSFLLVSDLRTAVVAL